MSFPISQDARVRQTFGPAIALVEEGKRDYVIVMVKGQEWVGCQRFDSITSALVRCDQLMDHACNNLHFLNEAHGRNPVHVNDAMPKILESIQATKPPFPPTREHVMGMIKFVIEGDMTSVEAFAAIGWHPLGYTTDLFEGYMETGLLPSEMS